MSILNFVIIVPLVFALAIYFISSLNKNLNKIYIAFNAITSCILLTSVAKVVNEGTLYSEEKFLFLDSLGAIFLTLIAVTGFLVNLYATTYMKWEVENNHMTNKQVKNYYALSFVFIFTMSLSVICNNLAFMWAAIEATTLSSVFLVAIHKDKDSVESGYKYIALCSVGLAFALYATVLLYSSSLEKLGSNDAMLYTSLLYNAKFLDPAVLKLIFIFALIGFGTKAGLVPTHTWLPDAHSQGPAPTSAMLSGVLLKCAMLALIRFYAITANAAGFTYVEHIMIITGVLTLFVAGFFLIRQHDVKRMFAYHSIVHMGVIAFALGVGGVLGIFAALFHCMAHSFTKALAFCTTGNIQRIYGHRDMSKMGGMIHIAPLSCIMFGIAICSLVGVPGFAIFVSEFMSFKAAIADGKYISVILFAIALAIIFIADFSHFFMASFGSVKSELKHNKEMTLKENLPIMILSFLVIFFGVWQVDWWMSLINSAVHSITNLGFGG